MGSNQEYWGNWEKGSLTCFPTFTSSPGWPGEPIWLEVRKLNYFKMGNLRHCLIYILRNIHGTCCPKQNIFKTYYKIPLILVMFITQCAVQHKPEGWREQQCEMSAGGGRHRPKTSSILPVICSRGAHGPALMLSSTCLSRTRYKTKTLMGRWWNV